jgi:hypothetical protein
MISIKEVIAVFLFVSVLAVDVRFGVSMPWYGLLLCLISYLFGVKPTKSISSIIESFSKLKK